MLYMCRQQGGAIETQASRNIAPLTPVFTGIPLPVSLCFGEIHACRAWAGPLLCQHHHLGPHQDPTAPLRAGGITPMENKRKLGPETRRVAEAPAWEGPSWVGPLGALSLLPDPCWVDWSGEGRVSCSQEEVKHECGFSVAQLILGPGQCTHPPGSPAHAAVCPYLLSCPTWGEMGRDVCCTPVPPTQDLRASGQSLW